LVTTTHWMPFGQVEPFAPSELRSWLAEPGLLTARIRALCGERMRFRMLGPLRRAPLLSEVQQRLGVDDTDCWLREIEFRCEDTRLVYAQTVLPETTVALCPWLRDLGEAPIGEALRRSVDPVEREPLEYAALHPSDALAQAAMHDMTRDAGGPALWARRAVYRLSARRPILVQEVFLPALLRVPAHRAVPSEGAAR
jgi:chorismate--pyruvate lyase